MPDAPGLDGHNPDCAWRDSPIAGTFTLTFNGLPPLSDYPATNPSVDQAFGSGMPWIDSEGWLGDKGQGWRVLGRDINLKPGANTVIYRLRRMEQVDV